MKIIAAFILLLCASNLAIAQQIDSTKKVMDGFPPTRESQVTLLNYREYPYSQWSFRNIGAPMHMLMLPRSGSMHQYKTSVRPAVGECTHKRLCRCKQNI